MSHINPRPQRSVRNFFEVVGKVFDQKKVPFLIPDLERDLPFGVYVTMARAKRSEYPEIRRWYQECTAFFAEIARLLDAHRSGDKLALGRARAMLTVPEQRDVRLGYSTEGHCGSGLGTGNLQALLLAQLLAAPELANACALEPDMLACARQFHLDRPSDIVVAIGKEPLIVFTQRCAQFFGFDPACMQEVRMRVWDAASMQWSWRVYTLPVDDDGLPIVLVPTDLVRSAPPVSAVSYFEEHVGPKYQGSRTKDALLAHAALNPGDLGKYATERLKDPDRFKPRRDLFPTKPGKKRRKKG